MSLKLQAEKAVVSFAPKQGKLVSQQILLFPTLNNLRLWQYPNIPIPESSMGNRYGKDFTVEYFLLCSDSEKVDTMSRPKLTMKIVSYGVKAKVIFDLLSTDQDHR